MSWMNRLRQQAARGPLLELADRYQRDQLTAGILTPDCPACPAPGGTGCDPYFTRGAEVVRLDRDPLLFAHSVRLLLAISLGYVSRGRVTAQFGDGTLPAGLREADHA